MSKRKQKHNPITYREKPPLWMQIPEKKVKKEPPKEPVKPESPHYEQVIILEAEAAEQDEENYQVEVIYEDEIVEQPITYSKEKTREFVDKNMFKLMQTIGELVEYDDQGFVVNFILEMHTQAKKKLWELQRVNKNSL